MALARRNLVEDVRRATNLIIHVHAAPMSERGSRRFTRRCPQPTGALNEGVWSIE